MSTSINQAEQIKVFVPRFRVAAFPKWNHVATALKFRKGIFTCSLCHGDEWYDFDYDGLNRRFLVVADCPRCTIKKPVSEISGAWCEPCFSSNCPHC